MGYQILFSRIIRKILSVCHQLNLAIVWSVLNLFFLSVRLGSVFLVNFGIEYFFLIFPRKQDLTFHANCLQCK